MSREMPNGYERMGVDMDEVVTGLLNGMIDGVIADTFTVNVNQRLAQSFLDWMVNHPTISPVPGTANVFTMCEYGDDCVAVQEERQCDHEQVGVKAITVTFSKEDQMEIMMWLRYHSATLADMTGTTEDG